jgi:hypothetical protein
LLERPRALVTLLTGGSAAGPRRLLAELRTAHPELELEVHEGGSCTTRCCSPPNDLF